MQTNSQSTDPRTCGMNVSCRFLPVQSFCLFSETMNNILCIMCGRTIHCSCSRAQKYRRRRNEGRAAVCQNHLHERQRAPAINCRSAHRYLEEEESRADCYPPYLSALTCDRAVHPSTCSSQVEMGKCASVRLFVCVCLCVSACMVHLCVRLYVLVFVCVRVPVCRTRY